MLISKLTECGVPVSQLTKGSERLVRLRCDWPGCNHISTVTWSNYQQSLRVHPKRAGKTYCQPCGKKVGGLTQRGRSNPRIGEFNAARAGSKSPGWRGGRYTDSHGYVMVFVGKTDDTTSGWRKYRKEHILVMEQHLGRKLTRSEVVHHIDNVKSNNSLDNLFLTTHAGHKLAHVSLTLSYMLLRAAGLVGSRTRATLDNVWKAYHSGKIYFDAAQGIYVAHLKSCELLEHPTG